MRSIEDDSGKSGCVSNKEVLKERQDRSKGQKPA
jgi:hypothetical protein